MELSQCPGEHEFRYSIHPHAGSRAKAEVYGEVERPSWKSHRRAPTGATCRNVWVC